MREIFNTPWGNQKVFVINEQATVKILEVEPNQALSFQYHMKRNESWFILKGSGTITIDDRKIFASEGEHYYIPVFARHTVEASEDGISILEYVTDLFDPSDIVRISDKYGRATDKTDAPASGTVAQVDKDNNCKFNCTGCTCNDDAI